MFIKKWPLRLPMALKVTLTLEMPMFQYLLYLIVSEKPFFPGRKEGNKIDL